MSNEPAENTSAAWHRYFAVAYNNRAWDLSIRERDPADEDEMLNAAHASALHWAEVGTELNRMRATMLLAEVHALLGQGKSSLAYARAMRGFFLDRDDTPDWEIAFTHAIDAHAAHVAGDTKAHETAYREAQAALDAISDPGDREVVQQTLDHVPSP
jgi:hypothetical protein